VRLGELAGRIAALKKAAPRPADVLHALVTKLTEAHETPRPRTWAVSDAPAEFIRAQLKGIVGFELPIAKLEGKWKMSQNRPAEDRAGVVQGLGREGEAEMAALVRPSPRSTRNLPSETTPPSAPEARKTLHRPVSDVLTGWA
jgi:predicted FMN-binding regulatory protein PaiB